MSTSESNSGYLAEIIGFDQRGMTQMPQYSRRDALKFGVFGAAALALPLERVVDAKEASDRLATRRLPRPYTTPFTVPPVLSPVRRTATTDYYVVTQQPLTAEIIPGLPTEMWGYNGLVPGPTIKTRRGKEAVVRQINGLPRRHPRLRYNPTTSTHLHGSPSLPQFDGYASDITAPEQFKDYSYPNTMEARTLWYHDHGLHHTAENVYMGLAAQYHSTDELEESLPIPRGEHDIPVILGDKIFAQDGSLIWEDNGHSGLWGDVILVNGRPWPVMNVKRRKYRFRILNGSIARGYLLELSTGAPMTVIATDGGLVPTPQPVSELRIGMAERYDVVIDFSQYRPGEVVKLRNRGVKNSIDYDHTGKVMAFQVTGDSFDPSNNEVPETLNPASPVMNLDPSTAIRTRRFEFVRTNGLWTINGKTWIDVINSDFRDVIANPGLGDVEVWEFQNNSGGWFHPVHVHLIDFKVFERNGRPPRPEELGPKDVVYVGEGETVRMVARFGPHEGRYMIHCHNLPHEDHDMMNQFQVGPPGSGPDPIEAALPQPLPAPAL